MSLTELSSAVLRLEASHSTGGLVDFGDRAYEDGLDRLLTAVHASADAFRPAGREAAHGMIVEALRNRLLLRDHEHHYPQIAQIPIDRPIFVLGLPRSGTTLLHNLLAVHPRLRAPLYWELRHPVTPPGCTADELVADVDTNLTALYRKVPALRTIHAQQAQTPDECTWLLANELVAMVFTFAFDIPDYLDWLLTTDLTDAFAAHRRQLQHILWRRPGGMLVLKDPYHALYLNELNTIYPDARFIYLHRNPAEVLSSLCSLRETVRRVHYRNDQPSCHGKQMLTLVKQLLVREQVFRHEHPMPTRALDIDYAALVADPVNEVGKIFEFLNLDTTDVERTALRAYLDRSPKHRFGVHIHTLTRFSLNESQIEQELSGLI